MKIKLTRPIAFFDLETTGTDTEKDRIVEIAVSILSPDMQIKTVSRRVNPTIPIPEGASAVHGITDADVVNEPTFKQISKGLLQMLEGCDIAGFNSNTYDVPLLYNEFARAGIIWDYEQFLMIDVCTLFKRKEPRDLKAAVKFYLGKDLEDAHSAKADIEATVDVFIAQLDRYEKEEDFPDTLESLALYTNYDKKVADLSGKFTYNEEGILVLNIGEHRGKPAAEQVGFCQWILSKNFPADTKKFAMAAITESKNK